MDFALPAQDQPGGSNPAREDPRLSIRVSTEVGEAASTIRIEGQLTVADLPDVREACASVSPPLRLDLSGLRSADVDGIRALRSLSETAELHGA